MVQAPVDLSIQQEFAQKFSGSMALHEEARGVIAGGINHDGRYVRPFPPYIQHADGVRKWDVDGNELLDYVMGHGALILGHNDPDVLAALRQQLDQGTHYGAGHEAEIRWAEAITRMVPSAERVKITGSGTEATLLAMRVARAYTGKPTIIKFEGHFHGWQDYALKGEKPPFDAPTSPGVLEQVMATVAVVPANDPDALEARLAEGDGAAVILEPSGGSWAMIPLDEGFLATVRGLASRHGALLIFDEVITGFRWAPGGAQERYGVLPDLTTLAKIVAGGMPGGALAGRADVMRVLEFQDDPVWNATRKVRHQGTYNANPLAAVAAVACLRKIADGSAQEKADALAARLRAGLNKTLAERDVPGFAWGDSSVFHIALGLSCPNRGDGDLRAPAGVSPAELKSSPQSDLNRLLYLAMLLEGVDLFAGGGMVSTVHSENDIDATVTAVDRVLGRLVVEGAFGQG